MPKPFIFWGLGNKYINLKNILIKVYDGRKMLPVELLLAVWKYSLD